MTAPSPQQIMSCDSCKFAEKTNSKTYPVKCLISKPVPMMVNEYCISWFQYVGCASHSNQQSEKVSIIQDEDGYIEERKIMQPCFGHEYEGGGFFCEHCKDKKECWVKMETGVIPTFIKPIMTEKSECSTKELDIFIYNHYRKVWDRIHEEGDYFNMNEIREMLRGKIIDKRSGGRYKISEIK